MNTVKYPESAMLPGIKYNFSDDEMSGGSLVGLEHNTMQWFSDFSESLRDILEKKNTVASKKSMVAHLCAYVASFSASSYGVKKSRRLLGYIIQLIGKQAEDTHVEFLICPLYESDGSKNTENLEEMRKNTPGSILNQTVRLGRIVNDIVDELKYNSGFGSDGRKVEDEDLFCPKDDFIELLETTNLKNIKEWEKDKEYPLKLITNQMAIQIGWLMGYFSYLDFCNPKIYMDYAVPYMKTYLTPSFSLEN